MNILLTGGAGYIGSHTAVTLSEAGHEVVLLDNFCNSDKSVLNRLKKILGKSVPFIETDIRQTDIVEKVLREFKIDAVIHFAGLKAVGESVSNPIEYYANNVQGTISLLEAMKSADIKTLVFSSSATVYGDPQYLPIDEDHPTSATNAYGRSKLHIENMLKDVVNSDSDWKIICLRYFNPIGAHISGLIGENPGSIPNNLMPYLARVTMGQLPHLNVFGNDYPTHDGTGVRDYIHVMDLAQGHLAALKVINLGDITFDVFNLGAGRGYSVLEILKSFELVTGQPIKTEIVARRDGDVAICYAKVDKAAKILDWTAQYSLDEACRSEWNFQINKD